MASIIERVRWRPADRPARHRGSRPGGCPWRRTAYRGRHRWREHEGRDRSSLPLPQSGAGEKRQHAQAIAPATIASGLCNLGLTSVGVRELSALSRVPRNLLAEPARPAPAFEHPRGLAITAFGPAVRYPRRSCSESRSATGRPSRASGRSQSATAPTRTTRCDSRPPIAVARLGPRPRANAVGEMRVDWPGNCQSGCRRSSGPLGGRRGRYDLRATTGRRKSFPRDRQ